MAGYVQWLAPRIDDLRRALPQRQRTLRDDFVRQGQHKRTPEIAASIVMGWETFLSFAEEVGPSPAKKRSRFWSVRAPRFSVRPLFRPDIKRARIRRPAFSPCSVLRSAAVALMSLQPATMARRTMPIAGAGSW
jgi:hypothetical protein